MPVIALQTPTPTIADAYNPSLMAASSSTVAAERPDVPAYDAPSPVSSAAVYHVPLAAEQSPASSGVAEGAHRQLTNTCKKCTSITTSNCVKKPSSTTLKACSKYTDCGTKIGGIEIKSNCHVPPSAESAKMLGIVAIAVIAVGCAAAATAGCAYSIYRCCQGTKRRVEDGINRIHSDDSSSSESSLSSPSDVATAEQGAARPWAAPGGQEEAHWVVPGAAPSVTR